MRGQPGRLRDDRAIYILQPPATFVEQRLDTAQKLRLSMPL